jgi:hypothetical protein
MKRASVEDRSSRGQKPRGFRPRLLRISQGNRNALTRTKAFRPPYLHFIRRVHRRYVVLRVLERTGLGVLWGCAAALPLLAIVLWRGFPALPLATAALSIGALAGMVYGLMTRPTAMEAAMEADRQLGWADLLSSAMSVSVRSSEDAWAGVVIQVADANCRTAAPSSVVLNRLGARAWGGIGLATALVVVLGLLPTYAVPTRAGDSQASTKNPFAALDTPEPQPQSGTKSLTRRTPRQEDPDDPRASRMGETEPLAKPQSGEPNPSLTEDHHPQNNASDPNGHGTGASHSDAQANAGVKPVQTGTQSKVASANGTPSGGVGTSSNEPGAGKEASGEAAGTSRERSTQTPPWHSADWSTHSQQAMDALDSGRIPDAYRDIVRGYFERP